MLTFFHENKKKKCVFTPYDCQHVKLYCCGPTVYDLIHIGNARPLVVFDVLYRVLKDEYPKVTYVRNITDVDDKINIRAAKNNMSIAQLTDKTIIEFQKDAKSLLCLKPDFEPRVTEHIDDIITLIKNILINGHGYVHSGNVLFDVSSFEKYGELSGRIIHEQIVGSRIAIKSYKRHALDFILWKPSLPHEPGWPSPWGYGRPGWHIECSAMSVKYLGKNFDLHGGGIDLIFPHHENELAQCLCGFKGSSFAKTWIHNGYLLINGEKMSKSLGNFYTVQSLRQEFPGEVLRFVLLQAHYRQPLDFTKKKCFESKKSLDRLYRIANKLRGKSYKKNGEIRRILCDDLNTSEAIALLFEYANALQKEDMSVADPFLEGLFLLGLGQSNNWFHNVLDTQIIESLIKERTYARDRKDYIRADQIRKQLLSQGIVLEDSDSGTTFRKL